MTSRDQMTRPSGGARRVSFGLANTLSQATAAEPSDDTTEGVGNQRPTSPTDDSPPTAPSEPSEESDSSSEATSRSRPPRASAARRARSSAPLSAVPEAPEVRRAKVVALKMDGLEHQLPDFDEPRQRDVTTQISNSLPEVLELARARWAAENFGAYGASPNISQFREALLRIGLKHLNDPEFIDLIPRDMRTGPRTRR